MKIGKQPKRMGQPSAAFLARQASSSEAAQPSDGSLRLYLDDERPCPRGWLLARSPKAFFDALEAAPAGKIREIALDWYLGAGVADGITVGHRLVEVMKERPELFSGLETVYLHSSDRQKAIEMMRIIEQPLREDWQGIPFFSTHVGAPEMDGSERRLRRPRRLIGTGSSAW
jgi:hypothetical protein